MNKCTGPSSQGVFTVFFSLHATKLKSRMRSDGVSGDYQQRFTPITQSHCSYDPFIKTASALSGLPFER